MERLLYVDKDLLKEKINESGLKVGFICEKLGLSRSGFYKKLNGYAPFRLAEIAMLCVMLCITAEDKPKIFKPKVNY